jgi:uncharacterized membrane protein YfcA
MQDVLFYILVASASFFAGFVNALAGGGTLITFPVLLSLGVPPIVANMTNTVALCPGYFGATRAQKQEILPQKERLKILIPAAVIGGLTGAVLLMLSEEKLFYRLVPFLTLTAVLLLLFQNRLKRYIFSKQSNSEHTDGVVIIFLSVFLASIYGGYFGAGLGVILISVLGLTIHESLLKINALKQILSLIINVAAALFFIFSKYILWPVAFVMAVGALLGGYSGGKFSKKISPEILKKIILGIGSVVTFYYFWKIYI